MPQRLDQDIDPIVDCIRAAEGIRGGHANGQLIGSVLCGTLVARASGEVVPRTTVGSIYGVKLIWDVSDFLIGLMLIPNVIGLIFLIREIRSGVANDQS